MALFHYFWRFAQICKIFVAFARKRVFVIVSVVKLFRNNNKNNFARKCCKFLANLCKSSEMLEQCHVKWWLKYRNNRSVSVQEEKCCKFHANLCKSSEILEQCHVKCWLKYRNNRSVSWLLSCSLHFIWFPWFFQVIKKSFPLWILNSVWKWTYWNFLTFMTLDALKIFLHQVEIITSINRMYLVFCYQNCSDLLWEKMVLVIEKNFWNSRLKVENLQNVWDH